MPYRIDIPSQPPDALDRLVQLGALDVEAGNTGGLAAILPDHVTPAEAERILGITGSRVSPATPRDDESVWLLGPRALQIGGLSIVPPDAPAELGNLRLADSGAFGTGHHPTTALCIEAIKQAIETGEPQSILDVGTGSGILALAALIFGVPHATGIDIEPDALAAAAANAASNDLTDRIELVAGGVDAVGGVWPLVVANVLTGPLIAMAPLLVRRIAGRGRLILSGIPQSAESEVHQAYRHVGMRHVRSQSRSGWTVLVLQASW